nr:HAMP domain-containing sensor histidine kinase [uncultured Anaerotignum sp.]
MLRNDGQRKTKRLSGEILELLLITALISLFFWGFLYLTANAISETYYAERGVRLSEGQWLSLQTWIRSISLLSAVILFLVLFLFLLGQKLAYLREIIQGVDALRTHRLENTIAIREANELTELAEHINFLSETERRLRQQESALQEERERMIRDLSHDIRTPLTAILSYTDYMSQKEGAEDAEMKEYFSLVRKKAQQMKGMTDRLLESSRRMPALVENGRLLMEQLAGEWEEVLEERFSCETSLEECADFQAEWDMQEILRIFDNLSSNVEKYADAEQVVFLRIETEGDSLRILQKNAVGQTEQTRESNKIGLESIRRIAEGYGGSVAVSATEQAFEIEIRLPITRGV